MSVPTKTISYFSAPLLAFTTAHAALNYEISSEQVHIGDSTTVSGSGSTANYSNETAVGDYAVFDIQTRDEFDNVTSDYAQLKVTYLSDNGNVGSNLMIGQTVNSQGLTDTGTLSVLATINGGVGTVTLQFDWYTFGSFVGGAETESSSAFTDTINYTTLDIDFQQIVTVAKEDVADYTLEKTSQLTATDNGTSIAFTDDGADTNVDNPETAVSFTSNGSGSQQIAVGKQSTDGNALFIFEFRDPSVIAPFVEAETIPVPEPSTAGLLLGGAVIAFTMLQRRRK
ncbi:PEP-CTERM sorting domain-containing protein [Thalassobacterium maritimum]|uniref:PEP-CTERM sorting domain-containing protein n=1 Tax=Thalassobacterium maritimum TaxID=3041265 RepID=UPI0028123757|nr:PEP-CTERM sorting domain-containing protein [Coraliomargarita sp. SDUM461003]